MWPITHHIETYKLSAATCSSFYNLFFWCKFFNYYTSRVTSQFHQNILKLVKISWKLIFAYKNMTEPSAQNFLKSGNFLKTGIGSSLYFPNTNNIRIYLSCPFAWHVSFQMQTIRIPSFTLEAKFWNKKHKAATTIGWFWWDGSCDPVQQKGHFVGPVYSEIMSKTVCKIKYKENQRKSTHCKTCIFKTIPSIFKNFVSLEGKLVRSSVRPYTNLNFLKSRQDVPFVVLGHICQILHILSF